MGGWVPTGGGNPMGGQGPIGFGVPPMGLGGWVPMFAMYVSLFGRPSVHQPSSAALVGFTSPCIVLCIGN